VLLHGADKADAEKVAHKLHRTLRERTFRVGDSLDLSIRASYGVATWPTDAGDVHELIRAADSAMYRVKGATRDGVAVAEALAPAR
jgi:diguanylate cyclase (GGDEF)-like protein